MTKRKHQHFDNCPHCGRPIAVSGYGKHVQKCPMNPQIRAIMIALADDGQGRAVRAKEYQARWLAAGRPGPGQTTINLFFDGWDNAAAALGLLPALRPGELDGNLNAPLKPHELNACKLRAHAERAPAARADVRVGDLPD